MAWLQERDKPFIPSRVKVGQTGLKDWQVLAQGLFYFVFKTQLRTLKMVFSVMHCLSK